MAKEINTSSLMAAAGIEAGTDERPTVIDVEHVSMVFNIANQQLNNLKEYAIALVRRELMFKEFIALDDVSLQVKKGDVFGILGTNGSGKSTLLKIIAGVLEPTRGTVSIHGTIAPLIELGAGFDFELTARENIYLNGALLGYPRKFIDEHFDDIVDFAEIGDFLDMPIKNYSSGMVARIAFAIATVIVPDILIVDEVLSVGDFMFQQKCEQKIQNLINEHDVTVLIVSHNNDQIERLCNKAIWIEKGHTRIVGSAEEVCGIYRALGGHTGSAESEASIIATLRSDVEPDEDALQVLAGDSRYSTSMALARTIAAPQDMSVVLAPGENEAAHLIAVSLAGALGGMTIIVRPDELSDATALLLAQWKPTRVVLVGMEGEFSPAVRDAVEHTVGAACDVASLSALDPASLARAACSYADAHEGRFGPVAFVAGEGYTFASATIAPYLARHGSRLLFATENEPSSAAIADELEGHGVEEVILLGDAAASDEIEEAVRSTGLSFAHLSGTAPAEAHDAAFRWLVDRHRATGEKLERLILTTLGGPTDSYSAAAHAARQHAIIMMIDHNDLDSLDRAISFIDDQNGALDQVFVIGNDACFNKTDRALIAKALARAKVQQAEALSDDRR